MYYIVKRASSWNNGEKPCEEAEKHKIVYNGDLFEVWFVELDTLSQLKDFTRKYGKVVLQESRLFAGTFEILIYDDYIE